MNELFDYLQNLIGQENCPIVSIHPVFGTTDNYFEIVMKNDVVIQIKDTNRINNDWIHSKAVVGLDEIGLPIVINSWDDKVKRSLGNDNI